MRRFFFDLMIGNIVKIDPGGMVFECPEATFVVANEMASHLFVWRDDLRDRDACIRVRNADGREIYRAAVEYPLVTGRRLIRSEDAACCGCGMLGDIDHPGHL
jgi:hypothetical protein